MADRDPQDGEILNVIGSADQGRIEPQALIDALIERGYASPSIIEALQRAIERGKISLDSEGMVVALVEYAHAA
ncbi:hypothetical protein [Sphingopyxis granuli]|uniref:hypothetical protein n=1 Tax=Sphingopyxis granuli TaxID=267128 RepID=UPI000831D48F|nr:hypothetical protein [Sphingopyxis granuli]